MKISEILTPDPQCISPEATLTEAAQTMKLLDVNRQKRLVGIISLGDMATRTHQEKLAGEVLECISERVMASR